MLTGNLATILILILLGVLTTAVVGIALYLIRQTKSSSVIKEEPPMMIEVDDVDPDMREGWGFVVKGQLVLHNNKPFVFKKKQAAIDYLQAKFPKHGQLVYQRWDLKKQQLIMGEVVKRGSDKRQKN